MERCKTVTMQIRTGDTFDPRVIALLDHHVTAARAQTAPGSAHALDLSGLRAPDVAFWTGWDGEVLVAVGALKSLSAVHGEVKSMHTLQTTRRRGFGGLMLRHIIAEARARRLQRLSLETGSWDYFKPAHALYQAHGFVLCGPFEGYAEDPNSLFLTLDLTGG
jgi:putative acetyltransferase